MMLATVLVLTVLGFVPKTSAIWIGTPAATGTVRFVTVWDLHDLFYTSITLSVPISNCAGSPITAFVANKQPNGLLNPTHDSMVRAATAAQLSGRKIDVWADVVTYTVFGSATNVCIIHQISLRND